MTERPGGGREQLEVRYRREGLPPESQQVERAHEKRVEQTEWFSSVLERASVLWGAVVIVTVFTLMNPLIIGGGAGWSLAQKHRSAAPAGSCVNAANTPGGADKWGGCWPGASYVGVPPGTTLTTYTGPMTITTPNTVIDAKIINGDMIIQASNVSITRSQFNTGSVGTDENSTGFSFSISDSTVNIGSTRAGTGVGAVNFTATRVEVTGGNRSMNCWKDCTITDSYVHGQFADTNGVYHESGIRQGARGIVRHNSIGCDAPDIPPDGGCSAALSGYGDFATVENMTIDRNLILGGSGGYCTYGGSTGGKPFPNAHDIKFTDNVYQRGTSASDHGTFICGDFGPITAFDTAAPGNVWTNNVWDTDGTAVPPAN